MSRNKFTVCYDVRINSALNETYASIIEKIRFITQDTNLGKKHDGHEWVYGSYEQLWENLFLNIETPSILRRHINYLEKQGVLISIRCQYEKLYRINQAVYERLIQEGSEKLGERLPAQTVENQQSDCADCQDLPSDCQKEGGRLSEPEQSALYINKDNKDREIETVGPKKNDLQFSPLDDTVSEPETNDGWNMVLGQLRTVKGLVEFDNKYRDLRLHSFQDGTLNVRAPSAIYSRLANTNSIARAYEAITGILPSQVLILAPEVVT